MGAVISACGKYRYTLTRVLQYDEPITPTGQITFVMLNPSTADATEDDPTIRRCIGFARGFKAEALNVVNLYALRATDPKELWKVTDPVGGSSNDYWIKRILETSSVIICAWGNNAREVRVREFLWLAPGS